MLSHLKMESRSIPYSIRKSRRARRLRVAVYCDSSVVVTVPWGFNESNLDFFLKQKWAWILDKVEHFKKFKGTSFIQGGKREYQKYKTLALVMAKQKIQEWNSFYRFSYNKVNVKNQKTRWGSCSKKGNLNFNYRIIFLSKEQLDYLIVHELCHLKEFNHSKRFWGLVEQTIPDYAKIKETLRNSIK